MELHWQPVGPLPAETYWRRRVLVVLAVLAVLVLAWLPFRGGGDDTLSADPSSSPSARADDDPTDGPSESPTPSPSPTPEPEPCPDDALEVAATADAEEYAPGSTAALALTIRNKGTVPCRRAVGQGAVELIITSGDDRVWSSDDCAPGGDQGEVVLEPGAEQAARATWPTARSAPGCPPDQPQAQPGTYRVTARVGELRVPGAVFRVGGG